MQTQELERFRNTSIATPSMQPLAQRDRVDVQRALHRDGIRARRWSRFEKAAHVIGRAIFGAYFVYNGINHFRNRRMLSEYAKSKGVAAVDIAVPGSGLLILAGGLSLLAGTHPKIGAALITTFLLAVSPEMHAFWEVEDPQQRTGEMVNFLKNMALVGAALMTAGHPEPWPLGVNLPAGA